MPNQSVPNKMTAIVGNHSYLFIIYCYGYSLLIAKLLLKSASAGSSS